MTWVSRFLGFCIVLHLEFAGRSIASRTSGGATGQSLVGSLLSGGAAETELEAAVRGGSRGGGGAPSVKSLLVRAGFVLVELLYSPPAAEGFSIALGNKIFLRGALGDTLPLSPESVQTLFTPKTAAPVPEASMRGRLDKGTWEEDYVTLADETTWRTGLDLLPDTLRGQLQDVRLVGHDAVGLDYRCRLGGVEVAMKLTKTRTSSILEAIKASVKNLERFGGGDIIKASMASRALPTGETVLLTISDVADTNLYELIYKHGLKRVSWANRIRMAVGILGALTKLADEGVVCRDIRPVNVAVVGDLDKWNGILHARLADLGHSCEKWALLQAGEAGVIAGSPHYMSPDDWAGRPDDRSDAWATGILLLELFAGSRPEAFFLEKYRRGQDVPLGQHPLRHFVMKEFSIKDDLRFQELQRTDPQVARVIRELLQPHAWRRLTVQKAAAQFRSIAEASKIDVTARFPL